MKKLKVYYGWSRINKIRKKRSLSVIFANAEENERMRKSVKLIQNTYYVRIQTDAEAEDGKLSNRILSGCDLFIDEKPFYGSLKKILEVNYTADSKNVSKAELERIRNALEDGFKKENPFYKEPLSQQLSLF